MSTILKIKRSSTNPTATPSSLGQGELAYGEGTSTYTDNQGATVTSYGKLFVGRGTETNGAAAGIDIIGGKYFTDLLDHGHGTITANSAVIVDSASKVDVWNVDNLTLDGNTISTTNSNGDLTVDTNGTGDVIIAGANTVGTNEFKINDGSTDRFVVDSFSGAVDITSPSLSAADTLLNISSTWNNASATFYGIDFDVTNTNSGPNSRLLNLSVGGADKFNVDVDGNVYATGGLTFANATSFSIQDDTTNAFIVKEGTNHYIDIDTNNDAEKLTLGNNITSVDVVVEDDTASAFTVKEGTSEYIAVDTTNGSELITFSTGNVDIDNDLNVDGGDITTNQTTFNLLNTNATTINAFGAATTANIATAGTTVEIGAATGTTNINNNLDVDGDVLIDGGDLNVSTTTFNLANTTATTVNFAGAATTLEIGAATGTTNINNDLDVDGDVNIDGGDLTVSTTTFNLANTNATTLNIGGAATTLELGATTGTTSVNNNLDVDGDANIDGGDLTTNQTTFNIINTTATTVNAFGAATTLNIGSASTEVDFGDLRIVGSTIYSDNSSAQTITIDPFPAGGDSGGNVVVRGNLQVSGTTTTVNSTQMTINDPVFVLGDSISEKTVTSAASSGQADVVLDDVSGLNVGDVVSGNAGVPNGTTIQSIDTGNTTITLSANLTAGIAASTNTAPVTLTFTQGADDNKDRGIEFKYYNGGLKQGFFGYDESGTTEGGDTTYYFTYIPDATNTSQVFSGTVGKAYFDTVKLEMGINKGVPFFDQYKRLTTTAAAGTSDATTSYQVLTTTSAGVPVWTTTIDGGTY